MEKDVLLEALSHSAAVPAGLCLFPAALQMFVVLSLERAMLCLSASPGDSAEMQTCPSAAHVDGFSQCWLFPRAVLGPTVHQPDLKTNTDSAGSPVEMLWSLQLF